MSPPVAWRHRARGLILAAVLATTVGPAAADRLYLDGGGMIETDSWWLEGSTLVYQSVHGTVGIPRSVVLKIEPTQPRPESGDAAAAPPITPREAPEPVLSATLIETLREAKSALERRDFQEAADLYRDGLDLADADFQLPRVGYALSQIALGEDELALGVVLDGLARDPRHPGLLELLGDLRNRQERVPDALRSWRAAFDGSPNDRLREKVEKAEREMHAGRDFELAATSHFNVRYDGHVDTDLARAVMEHLEAQFWILADDLDHAPRQPITVVLYPTREFRDVTQAAEWVGGLYDGKIRVPLGGLRSLNPVAAGVLSHELTHAIVHAKTRGNCPRWLHEGLAQRFEGRPLTRADLAQVAARLEVGEPAAWADRGFSYPMALSLCRYLEARNGFHRVVDLLEELGRGTEPDQAMDSVYGIDYARLCDEWKESLVQDSPR